jgi:hypothetical protein
MRDAKVAIIPLVRSQKRRSTVVPNGRTSVLAGAKAFLEHGLHLNLVPDRAMEMATIPTLSR